MLTYSITRQWLFGDVAGKQFHVQAVSGGARGSTKGLSQNDLDSWNTSRKANATGSIRGGPLSPGFYIVHKPQQHPHLGRAAFLEETLTSLIQQDTSHGVGIRVTDRGGFFIHTQGPRGSDGCIVPLQRFKELMDALETAAPLALHVIAPGRPWTDFDENALTVTSRTA